LRVEIEKLVVGIPGMQNFIQDDKPGNFLRFNTHWSAPPALARSGGPLRVEFLLKTDSDPEDTGVTLLTLATPGNPFARKKKREQNGKVESIRQQTH